DPAAPSRWPIRRCLRQQMYSTAGRRSWGTPNTELGRRHRTMKKLLFALAVLTVLGVIGAASWPSVAVGQQRDARAKWEYKALTRAEVEDLAPKGAKHKLTDDLNTLGSEGWDLVAVEPGAVVGSSRSFGGVGSLPSTYLFKRSK